MTVNKLSVTVPTTIVGKDDQGRTLVICPHCHDEAYIQEGRSRCVPARRSRTEVPQGRVRRRTGVPTGVVAAMSEEITFRVTDINSATLTEEMAEQLRAQFANRGCWTYWGSHGCDGRFEHDGGHTCDCGSSVDRDGMDEGGFQWHLYGADTERWWDDAPSDST